MKQATTITATEMHKRRGEIIRRCFRDGEHFIVERDGLPLVAIIPIGDYRRLQSEQANARTPEHLNG
jgi:antitoxin (DNA-binding transcriptional repressor) of toxin-antitoxin stability system